MHSRNKKHNLILADTSNTKSYSQLKIDSEFKTSSTPMNIKSSNNFKSFVYGGNATPNISKNKEHKSFVNSRPLNKTSIKKEKDHS